LEDYKLFGARVCIEGRWERDKKWKFNA